jgi:hypothetical protein
MMNSPVESHQQHQHINDGTVAQSTALSHHVNSANTSATTLLHD